jgi:hypothetical protein
VMTDILGAYGSAGVKPFDFRFSCDGAEIEVESKHVTLKPTGRTLVYGR